MIVVSLEAKRCKSGEKRGEDSMAIQNDLDSSLGDE
jgi:hypothetical protein